MLPYEFTQQIQKAIDIELEKGHFNFIGDTFYVLSEYLMEIFDDYSDEIPSTPYICDMTGQGIPNRIGIFMVLDLDKLPAEIEEN